MSNIVVLFSSPVQLSSMVVQYVCPLLYTYVVVQYVRHLLLEKRAAPGTLPSCLEWLLLWTVYKCSQWLSNMLGLYTVVVLHGCPVL